MSYILNYRPLRDQLEILFILTTIFSSSNYIIVALGMKPKIAIDEEKGNILSIIFFIAYKITYFTLQNIQGLLSV